MNRMVKGPHKIKCNRYETSLSRNPKVIMVIIPGSVIPRPVSIIRNVAINNA
jgi:hypothetical protein